MKISLNWLNEYVDVSEFFNDAQTLDKILTDAGLEVEGIENQKEAFNNVVIGQVVVLDKHPDADKLTLCQVDVGKGENQQIICGAKNHKQGDKVVVALPGAVLPGDFAIKKSKIRGVESLGMLCSKSELGLADQSEGIEIVPEGTSVGTPFSDYAGLNDVVFELSVTPNRADCLSHVGLARELSCILNRPLKMPAAALKAGGSPVQKQIAVELKNDQLCPRYSGRALRGVKVGPSPAWLKQRLESIGLNSINNIVDVTNYVMMELGQPLHAFDFSQLKNNKLTVENSFAGEVFTTLDGTEIKLTGEELTIRDGERAVALAGVVGGLNSGVTNSTSDIFIESAHFTQATVRKTSRKFGVNTDSSYRFSRGTDPDGVMFALDRACSLMQEVAGGVASDDFYDLYPSPSKKDVISINKTYLEERLGYAVEMKDFQQWMKRLGCKVEASGEECRVNAPMYRWDINADVDLVEEYARLNGYDKLPESLPVLVGMPGEHDATYLREVALQDALKVEGCLQAVNYSFVSSKSQNTFLEGVNTERLGVKNELNEVAVLNPLNDETNVMRRSMFPALIKNLLHNYRHGNTYGRLYEMGYVFDKTEDSYKQHHRLGLMFWGQDNSLWVTSADRPVVYDLKSTVENTLRQLKAAQWSWKDVSADQVPSYIHPGQCAALFFEGKNIGFVGTMHPQLKANEKIREDVAFAEINIELLMRSQPKKPKLKALAKYPSVDRDIAFIVPDDVKLSEVVRFISKSCGKLLQELKVIDVYRGDKVEPGSASVVFRLRLQDSEGTLSEETLTGIQEKVIQTVVQKLPVTAR